MALGLPPEPNVPLLPLDDDQWDWRDFERFCLGFVRAQPDVADAHLYGTRGQDQRGIDIAARLTDGLTRTYQCRKWAAFTEGQAKTTVSETEYEADEHVILVTCEVGTQVRDYIGDLDSWSLLDKEDICRAVREIEPRERARRLIEDTFTYAWRRAFLGPPGPLAFRESDDFFRRDLDETRLLRHTWELVGRADLLNDLAARLATGQERVFVLVGRGGIGKTRVLRALAETRQPTRTVFFSEDHVPLTAEAVEDLPWTDALVIVDDAHRRDDLGPLIGATRNREERLTVVLATRPQRLEELRAQLATGGFEPGEIWISDPLADLPQQDVRSLARQALGTDFEHLAEHLAAVTADCPLVTVVGGQLLAQRAVAPELLEREADFRYVVLDRFRDEMLGRLSDFVDATTARELLVLLAALGPISVEDELVLTRIAEDLGVASHELRAALSELESAGIIVARGRLRRIAPDVLADHILHRACIDHDGRSTGRSDLLLARYRDVALTSLARNLAELDWRIGRQGGGPGLLAALWHDIGEQFRAAGADERIQIIEFIKPLARLAPDPVFDLVQYALQAPASPVEIYSGRVVTDEEVRSKLPPLLGSVALTPAYLDAALENLWLLGRADVRPANQHPEHPLRVLEELADYRLPRSFPESILELAERHLGDDDAADQPHSPLEVIRPLLARDGMSTRPTGLGLQMGRYAVSAERTADLRSRMRRLLVEQATHGDRRDRLLAAELLGDALTQPHGYFGQPVSAEEVDQWQSDQLAILDAIDEVMPASSDPHVRLALRDAVKWHVEHSAWPAVAGRARVVHDVPLTRHESLALSLLRPWEWAEGELSNARLEEFAVTLAADANAIELAEALDAEIRILDAGPRWPDAGPLLAAIAKVDPKLGEALARWCVDDPGRPLARFGGSLLAAARLQDPDTVRELMELLRAGDVAARRQLASYLSTGAWFDHPDGPEATMLRDLIADPDDVVVRVSLLTLLRLPAEHGRLATEVALNARFGDNSELADDFCMAMHSRMDQLSGDELVALLDKLRPIPRLEYWSNQMLASAAASHPDEVVAFLLDRASAGGDISALSVLDYDVDLLGGVGDDNLARLLRRFRNAALGAESRAQWELQSMYWRLTSDLSACLAVLLEWLSGSNADEADAALGLVGGAPWSVLLENAEFVAGVLEAARARGTESFDRARDTLFVAMVIGGGHTRALGHPSERDLRLRDEGREKLAQFPRDSPAHRFFADVVERAERNIADDAAKDEERAL